jgi:Spy/CpxP family protein refolding chaperone
MHPKRIALAIGLLALAMLPGRTFAQGMFFVSTEGPMGFGGPPPFMMMLRTANLTADQQKRVRQILKAERTQIEPLFRQFHSIHERIADKLLASGSVTASDLAPLQKQAADLQQKIATAHLDTALKIRSVLTPVQIAKVAQVHAKLRSLHQQIQAIIGPQGPQAVGAAPMGPPPGGPPMDPQG